MGEDNGHGPLDLPQLLEGWGPYFPGEPSEQEVFLRLAGFGRAIHRLPDRAQREHARQVWEHYFQSVVPGIPKPWRVVNEAIIAGAVRDGGVQPWHWLTEQDLASLPAPRDLVAGYLPERALVLLYGPTGHGKTFVALDLALSIAGGHPWHGAAVRPGPVAYVAAEGVRGLAERVAAWKRDRDESACPGVRFLGQPVRFLETEQAARLSEELAGWDPPPVAVFIDTLAWCLVPGDENATQDMNLYLSAVHGLREATGATIVTLHHTGHDKSRERGSSALAAAMDTVIQAKRDGDVLVVSCEKQRDAAPFEPLRLRLDSVAGSLVPRLAVLSGDAGELTPTERRVLEVLHDIALEDGVSTSNWLSASEVPRRTFFRSVRKLLEVPLIRTEGERGQRRYWPITSTAHVPSANEVPF